MSIIARHALRFARRGSVRDGLVSRAAGGRGEPSGSRAYVAAAAATMRAEWYTPTEEASAPLLAAVEAKVAEFRQAQGEGESVQDKIERSRVLKELGPLVDAYEGYAGVRKAIADLDPFLSDPDPSLRELFASERTTLLSDLDAALSGLPALLLPPLETGPLPFLLSLNAGVGGSEAALFVDEIARMYTRFAETRGWRVDVMSRVEGAGGKGLREASMKVEPKRAGDGDVYGCFMWEKGVHRVQRVPVTETQGRVHTSTVAVVVMPIFPERTDDPLVQASDVRTEVMRSRGAGGQHVNKTESAVRLTHVPTGITVSMQDSRSQHQNRAWAWDVLRARLAERRRAQEVERRRESRRSQVKGADRGDKVRTYNFPQDRMTDHRIGLSLTGLRDVLDGDGLDYVVAALKKDFEKRRLESIMSGEGDLEE
ncbi:Peptide chain release factor 1, mitochondrial [Cryptotrichosporon argae]